MADGARSDDPAVQHQLDRLAALSLGGDRLGLERIVDLLDRLGRPQDAMPPVLHVAGTNGKGSTCAFLRAGLEAAGHKVHVFTSPHLVRYNERIRLAGRLIDDVALGALLEEVLDAGADLEPSFFEVTTAVGFLAFARTPADACVIEVGLGGRLDATNVVGAPLVCGIASLGLDHQSWLGPRLINIATEKAGIAKPGTPLVTQLYPPHIASRVGEIARKAGAPWLPRGGRWDAIASRNKLRYSDEAGELALPLPRLSGRHQALNAGLAVAMLRHQRRLSVPAGALSAAMGWADWPARLQQLGDGPLTQGREVWIDGAHNAAAARALARAIKDTPRHIVLGILANKDASAIVDALRPYARSLTFVSVPDHASHDPAKLAEQFAGRSAGSLDEALAGLASPILIAGSLYLAGEALRANLQTPD
ncbi:folylpolyglutamate synthase/dihydrofolate synthase family protein [Sphingomonas sp.]|uniref:bifunctional folylpolyglutamate synthase/dihydrofolate synthase n=1 Tax=Sphingomonas sp. TaxID=28214 RepID=UPI00325FCFB2